jgi:hypothetical protein
LRIRRFAPRPGRVHGQFGGRDGQAESARAGASRVDVQHPVALLDRGPVRVAGDDDLHARGDGLEVDLGKVVDHVDEDPAEAKELAFAQAGGPGAAIVVAAHGRDRGDGAKGLQHRGVADVAAVDDVVAAPEEGEDFRTQQAVGVGNEADPHQAALAPESGVK